MKLNWILVILVTLAGNVSTTAFLAIPTLRSTSRLSTSINPSIRIGSLSSAHVSIKKFYSKPLRAADQPVEAEGTVDYYALDSADQAVGFGDFSMIASQGTTGRQYTSLETLGKEGGPKDGDVVWIRGRVSSVRAKGNACFMVLRSGTFNTVQACHFKDKENPDESKKMIKYVGSLTLESIVDIMGVVVAADVKSCSVSNVELQIKRIYAVSFLQYLRSSDIENHLNDSYKRDLRSNICSFLSFFFWFVLSK